MSRTIVITGAGVGLGRALAKKFATDGDNVVLLGRTLSKVEAVAKEIGDRAMAVACDVSSPDSVRSAFASIARKYSRIDVLINNAAVFEPFKIIDATDEQILGAVNTNLAGPMFCVRSAIPLLVKGSIIINITSESVEVPFPHLSVYQSSKAGLERFSKSLQQELEPEGIRVTNIRAGQMFEEGKTWDVNPEARVAFGRAAIAAGINLMERPISQFESVVDVVRAVVNLPPDLQVLAINFQARKAN
jgi:NAD(P)-dependent dehydrogenase (short-subunit alcohol dehydrogenase family)